MKKNLINFLPLTKTEKLIEKKIRKALYDFKMLENIDSLLISLSGGKDSLTLLLMLSNIVGRGFPKVKLFAAYVEKEFYTKKNETKKYLEEVCSLLGIQLIFLKSSLKENCYSCSRERRSLVFNLAKKLNIKTVALGHHLDDNFETLLLNLFQKGEFEAMLPKIKMHKFEVTIIRPLIYVNEKNIKTFASNKKFNNISCKCPKEKISRRNVAKNLFFHIEKLFPEVRRTLLKSIFLYGSKKALREKK